MANEPCEPGESVITVRIIRRKVISSYSSLICEYRVQFWESSISVDVEPCEPCEPGESVITERIIRRKVINSSLSLSSPYCYHMGPFKGGLRFSVWNKHTKLKDAVAIVCSERISFHYHVQLHVVWPCMASSTSHFYNLWLLLYLCNSRSSCNSAQLTTWMITISFSSFAKFTLD